MINDLKASWRLCASSSALVKRAVNGFDTAIYTKHLKVKPGKLQCLAKNEMKKCATTVTPDPKHEAKIPNFDIKKANKTVPEVDWN